MPRKSRKSRKYKKRGGLVSRETIKRMTNQALRSQIQHDEESIVEAMESAFQQCLTQIVTRFPNDIYTIDDHRRICDFIIVNRIELYNINVSVSDFNSKVLSLIEDLNTNNDIPHRTAFHLILTIADNLANESRLYILMSDEFKL